MLSQGSRSAVRHGGKEGALLPASSCGRGRISRERGRANAIVMAIRACLCAPALYRTRRFRAVVAAAAALVRCRRMPAPPIRGHLNAGTSSDRPTPAWRRVIARFFLRDLGRFGRLSCRTRRAITEAELSLQSSPVWNRVQEQDYDGAQLAEVVARPGRARRAHSIRLYAIGWVESSYGLSGSR